MRGPRPVFWSVLGTMGLVLGAGCARPEKPATAERVRRARAQAITAQLKEPDKAAQALAGTTDRGEGSGLTEEQRKVVVARVGGEVITLGDVERRLASMPSFERARYETIEGKIELLHSMVQLELLALEARKRGYDRDPDVVLAMKRAMVDRFVRNELTQLLKVSEIPEAEIRAYYEAHQSDYHIPEAVHIRHILMDRADRAKAEQVLADIRAAIAADPARAKIIFAEFARRHSGDQDTNELNGDLGFVRRNGYLEKPRGNRVRVPKSVVEVAFGLKRIGEVSGLVESDEGIHIVQLLRRRPEVHKTLDDVRVEIRNVLLRKRQRAARKAYIERLRAEANVEVHEEVLRSLEHAGKSTGTHGKATSPPASRNEGSQSETSPPTGSSSKPRLPAPLIRPPAPTHPLRLAPGERHRGLLPPEKVLRKTTKGQAQ